MSKSNTPAVHRVKITDTGRIYALDKKSKGLDLSGLGRESKQRISDIQWDDESQHWKIQPLANDLGVPFEFPVATIDLAQAMGWPDGAEKPEWYPRMKVGPGHTALFKDYDDAVAAEVDYIQALWKKGANES